MKTKTRAIEELVLSELTSGIRAAADGLSCAVCGEFFERGVVYRDGDALVDAALAARRHVDREHGGMLEVLLGLPREKNGLTEVQRTVVQSLAQNVNDREIGKRLGGRAESTVRNHRFQLRRRFVEARIMTAIADILELEKPAGREGSADGPRPATGSFISFHSDLPADDERIVTTVEEAGQILGRYMEERDGVRLTGFPRKQKEKLVLLKRISEEFLSDRVYSEAEVNGILRPIYDDYVTIRRYLIDYRFLVRKSGGREYRLNT